MMTPEERLAWRASVRAGQLAVASEHEDARPAESESFTCPRCGATSWNPADIREGYCGRCHDWTATSPRRSCSTHRPEDDEDSRPCGI